MLIRCVGLLGSHSEDIAGVSDVEHGQIKALFRGAFARFMELGGDCLYRKGGKILDGTDTGGGWENDDESVLSVDLHDQDAVAQTLLVNVREAGLAQQTGNGLGSAKRIGGKRC